MKPSVTITLNQAVLDAAKDFAKAERRSLSQQAEMWIEDKLRSLGALPKVATKAARK